MADEPGMADAAGDHDGSVPLPRSPAPSRRGVLRSVALPTEHGGWGLTLEPAVLGLFVASSGAGWCLAAAALVAFVARTPLKLVLVDQWRHRRLERTVIAGRVAAVEVVVLVALVAVASVSATGPFWWPALVAAPLVVVEVWFDMRSRSRQLIPELAGAVGVCAVAAMIVLADGAGSRLALSLWLILAARVITSIPFVRAEVARIHHRRGAARSPLVADVAALAVAAGAVGIEPSVLAGAIAIIAVVVFQRLSARGPVPRVGVIGARQMAIGFGVVVVTGLGVLAP